MLVLCYLFLLLFQNVICVKKPSVESNVGKIKGLKANDGDYYMYLGIPYAKVNTSNPFGNAAEYPPFDTTFEAYNEAAACPQVNEFDNNNNIIGAINCLNLNVYVPTTNAYNLPVMIWLYGGGFRFGQAGRYYYGPNYLLQHEVILVTLNYRLGPYGFMCLDIPEVPGNQGLKDQYLAFKWVKDNIKAFGGNTDQITVFGQSAGGHAIDLHLVSTKPTLFEKIILESGSDEALTMLYEPDKSAPFKIAKYLGFETKDIREALSYLTNADTNRVIAAVRSLGIQFKPCVESIFDDVVPYINKSWITNLEIPKVKNMPVLMGFNRIENAYEIFPKPASYYKNLTIVSDNLQQVFNFTGQKLEEMIDIVSDFYFGDEELSEKLKLEVSRFISDITYIHPVHRTMMKYIENGAANIYFYVFSYVGIRNRIITTIHEKAGNYLCCASHLDEVSYLFNRHDLADLRCADQIIMKRLTTMWTNFAKYSNPTPRISEVLPVKWKPITPEIYYYLNIDTELTLGRRPLHERMAFWDLFYKHNKKYQKDYASTSKIIRM